MTVKLLQQAETQLSLAHDDLRKRNDPKAAQEHVRRALLNVREALADTVAPRPPRLSKESL